MTKHYYEVSAKGERIPESHPNSTCKTWKLITSRTWANSTNAALDNFKMMYEGEYTEILDVKTITPSPEELELYETEVAE